MEELAVILRIIIQLQVELTKVTTQAWEISRFFSRVQVSNSLAMEVTLLLNYGLVTLK